MWPGFDSRSRRQMWVEFVVGFRPCSERFFSGYSGFPLSSKTNISKFQLTLKSPEREEPIKYVCLYVCMYVCKNNSVIYILTEFIMEVCLESRFDFAGLTAFTLVPLENVQLKIFHLVFILTILYYTLTNTNTINVLRKI